MNWTAISTVVDLVGGVVVVVTLAYVAIQIRQNTTAIVANSRQILLDGDLSIMSDYMTYAVDPYLIGDEAELTPEDERRFIWLLIKALRVREFAWHQYQAGSLDEVSWRSYMAPIAGMFATERAQAVLTFYAGDSGFMEVLAAWLRDAAASAPAEPEQ